MKIELPVPPASNRYWRVFRGRTVVSVEARRYREQVRAHCQLARIRPLHGPVTVTIAWRRARRSGDLDGRSKVVLDAIQGHAYDNDSQIVELHLYRSDDKDNPGITLTVDAA